MTARNSAFIFLDIYYGRKSCQNNSELDQFHRDDVFHMSIETFHQRPKQKWKLQRIDYKRKYVFFSFSLSASIRDYTNDNKNILSAVSHVCGSSNFIYFK